MRKANIHETEATLSRPVGAAEAGEKLVLARAGRPVTHVVRLEPPGGARVSTPMGHFPVEFSDVVSRPH